MKTSKAWLLLLVVVAIGLFVSFISKTYADHPVTNNVTLFTEDGGFVGLGDALQAPYSPKRSCGTTDCHASIAFRYNLNSSAIYEDSPASAEKIQLGLPYSVPYPFHGVTAGYHFQMGRNVPWGSVQKDYYNLPEFTSSPGMYGKY